jgi:nucleoside-diphosphate-sugar epimerase
VHVLVVGGTRFLGYFLVWRLLAAGKRVTILNRGTSPDPFEGRVERLQGDRTGADLERLLSGRTFDAAVDFAAYEGRDTERAIHVLRGNVGHYVHISTGQLYLIRATCPRPSREADSEGPLLPEPREPDDLAEWRYGVGKRACEQALVAAFEREGFPSTRLRLPMVNGERDHLRRIESYLVRLLDGGPVILPDGGAHEVRHVYGLSVVSAIADLLGNATTFGQVYNLAQDETPTLAALVSILARALGAPARLVPVPSSELLAAGLAPAGVSPFSSRWMSFIDPARAKRELGFRHAALEVYLERIVASFLAHPPGDRPASYEHRAREVALAARFSRT